MDTPTAFEEPASLRAQIARRIDLHSASTVSLRGTEALPLQSPANRSVTWRSLLAGLIAVTAVCSLTPYNDFVYSDTSVTAGLLPLGAVVIEFLLIVAVNAPLHRFAPRHALRTGELAVVLLMTLVACAIPNWGLMRFLIPTPVAPFHLGASSPAFWKVFNSLNLPHWLFPVQDMHDGRTDPIVQWFYTRVPPGQPIPYRAWLVPLAAWGVFITAMLATLAAMARLIVDQWVVNERLPFPLVQVQAALIEPPAPGRVLNDLIRSPLLWIGLGGAFVIRALACLNVYFPKYVPKIPLGFDLTSVLSQEPFYFLRPKFKAASLSFMAVGATYFIRSRAAMSVWGIYVLVNLADVAAQMRQQQITDAIWADQHLGSCIAFILGIFWIGRHHWLRILKNAFGLGRDSNYVVSFWIALLGTAVMIGWLRVVGVQPMMCAMIVGFILAGHLIATRVVAETGLPVYRVGAQPSHVYTNLPVKWFSGRDIYFSGVFTSLGAQTTRDGLTAFATHGLGILKNVGADEKRERRRIGGAIALALIVGSLVAGATTLHCQYTYPTPVARDTSGPARNNFGADYVPQRDLRIPMTDFGDGHYASKQHNSWEQIGIGFGITALLEVASLRWASWPLLPVGYVASFGAFVQNAWFSIFVGWLAKVLIVRLGGSALFQKARPFFVGIIFGEALAAGVWLIVNAVLVAHGGQSQAVKFLL